MLDWLITIAKFFVAIRALPKEINELSQKIEELETQLNRIESERIIERMEMVRLRSEIEGYTRIVERLGGNHETLEEKLNGLKSRVEAWLNS